MDLREDLYCLLNQHNLFSEHDLMLIINIQKEYEEKRRIVPSIEKICFEKNIKYDKQKLEEIRKTQTRNVLQKLRPKKQIKTDILNKLNKAQKNLALASKNLEKFSWRKK